MSRKKSRPDPRELKKRQQKKARESGGSSDEPKSGQAKKNGLPDGKNHLSPVAALLVIVPFVAIAGVLCWLYLRPAPQPDRTADPDNPGGQKTQQTGNPNSKQNASPTSWNRDLAEGEGWKTETDQKEEWSAIDDPNRDGWKTEVFANKVTEQFNKLKKLLASSRAIDKQALNYLAGDSLSAGLIQPSNLKTTYQDRDLLVRRAVTDLEANPGERQTGIEAFVKQLNGWMGRFGDREKVRMKIKVFKVIPDNENRFSTYQTIEVFGPNKDRSGLVEENAMWKSTWSMVDGKPVMQSIQTTKYESVERAGKPIFADCTEAVFAEVESFRNQLLQGYNYWLDRGQFHRFLSVLSNPGIAISDINGDGLPDIYVCQESGLPNLLYLQKPDGTLSDASKDSGVDILQNSSAALIVDLDNDGNQDLVIGVTGGVVFASGDGTGKFKIQKVVDTEDHVLSLSAVDYNLDGKLDVYAGVYFPDGIDGAAQSTIVGGAGGDIAYADANDDGGSNALLKNVIADGKWEFEDVTQSVGLDQNNRRMTLAASWEDFDNDGDQDLYVANDYGLNNLYRNDRDVNGNHRFVDVSQETNAEDTAFGMSVAWSDYNRDGWMDLYIGNMFSYAGHRITYQNQFRKNESEKIRKGYQRFAQGSTLLKNLGAKRSNDQLKFEDRSLVAGANKARWAWGSRLADFNNDGWDDIVAVNGYISTGDTGDC